MTGSRFRRAEDARRRSAGIDLVDLNFPASRTMILNKLEDSGINTIQELCAKTPQQLHRIRGMGRKSICSIQCALSAIGSSLQRSPGEWFPPTPKAVR